MIQVSVHKQSNFPVNANKVKKRISETLKSQGIVSDFSVSVAIVGEAKMDELVKKYYKREGENGGNHPHPILTFPTNDLHQVFIEAPKQIPDLGEMIISYPQAVERAKTENRLIQEVIDDLAEHGALHLAGVHH